MSKKYTCRMRAFSGSTPRAAAADCLSSSGTVSFSSTLSASPTSFSISSSSGEISRAVGMQESSRAAAWARITRAG